jgi:hypothetical protein
MYSSKSIEPRECAELKRILRERSAMCGSEVSYHQAGWVRVAKTAERFSNSMTWLLEVRHMNNKKFLFAHSFVLDCLFSWTADWVSAHARSRCDLEQEGIT